jgi:hypothetical protein
MTLLDGTGAQGSAAAAQRGNSSEILRAHRQAGREFAAGGVRSFVREEGSGPAVLCRTA